MKRKCENRGAITSFFLNLHGLLRQNYIYFAMKIVMENGRVRQFLIRRGISETAETCLSQIFL
jgi:hypothetical protein